ncbi:Uncharacterised protein [Chlamydia trachomatis]|nr:Uncharacterised protein [Chlamydia trachomatis]
MQCYNIQYYYCFLCYALNCPLVNSDEEEEEEEARVLIPKTMEKKIHTSNILQFIV